MSNNISDFSDIELAKELMSRYEDGFISFTRKNKQTTGKNDFFEVSYGLPGTNLIMLERMKLCVMRNFLPDLKDLVGINEGVFEKQY